MHFAWTPLEQKVVLYGQRHFVISNINLLIVVWEGVTKRNFGANNFIILMMIFFQIQCSFNCQTNNKMPPWVGRAIYSKEKKLRGIKKATKDWPYLKTPEKVLQLRLIKINCL